MTKEEIIAAIRVLTDFKGVTCKEIETTLGMPKNCLSGMLNGSRGLPEKWERPLINFIQAKTKGAKEIIIPIEGSKVRVGTHHAKKHGKSKAKTGPVQAPTPEKTPPSGLTKAQQLRWHRENNQTLQ